MVGFDLLSLFTDDSAKYYWIFFLHFWFSATETFTIDLLNYLLKAKDLI